MKVLCVSDVHREHWRTYKVLQSIIQDCKDYQVDVLVLAGDIDSFQDIAKTIAFVCSALRDVFVMYVPGNHEYYGSSIHNDVSMMLWELKIPNLVLLENAPVTYKGVEFHGCVGWIDHSFKPIHHPEEIRSKYARFYNDFHYIKDFEKTLEEGKSARLRLFHGLGQTTLPKIVVTHFIPCKELISLKYINSPINACFANDWLPEIEKYSTITAWVYGHTHEPSVTTLSGVKFICNPVGYPRETEGYKPYILEVNE